MEKLILIGAGGYAKSVLDSIDYYNYEMAGFIDEYSKESQHLGFPILSHCLNDLPEKGRYVYFISIGNNIKRKVWYDRLISMRLRMINVVDRSAIVSSRATIGVGCFIGKMAIINSNVIINNDCIVNSRALVEHGCQIQNHVNLSTGSVINGDVRIGEGSFIGSGSITIGQLSVGKWSTVGAGSVVIHEVGDNITVAGVPARIIKEGAMLG